MILFTAFSGYEHSGGHMLLSAWTSFHACDGMLLWMHSLFNNLQISTILLSSLDNWSNSNYSSLSEHMSEIFITRRHCFFVIPRFLIFCNNCIFRLLPNYVIFSVSNIYTFLSRPNSHCHPSSRSPRPFSRCIHHQNHGSNYQREQPVGDHFQNTIRYSSNPFFLNLHLHSTLFPNETHHSLHPSA